MERSAPYESVVYKNVVAFWQTGRPGVDTGPMSELELGFTGSGPGMNLDITYQHL